MTSWPMRLAGLGVAAMLMSGSLDAQPDRVTGAACVLRPPRHCPTKDCSADIILHPGTATVPKSRRAFFPEYPCDLKSNEPVTFISSIAPFLTIEQEAHVMSRALWTAVQSPVVPPRSALFFSEYLDGNGNNKALEIFNPTERTIDLQGYVVEMYFNGSPSPETTIPLRGFVLPLRPFVLTHYRAASTVLGAAHQTSEGMDWFNGNDAVVLRRGETLLDVIGQIGMNPGRQWGRGSERTADVVLRRKSSVVRGDSNGNDPFDPALEWDAFARTSTDGFGMHVMD